MNLSTNYAVCDTSISWNSQESLWRAYKNGDPYALGNIYIEYFDLLCLYGRQFSPEDPSLVEDCIQDLFLQLYANQNKKNLSDTTSIKFYLMKSLRRSILALKKKNNKISIVQFDNTNCVDQLDFNLFDKEKKVLNKEQLKKCVLRLPLRQKEAIYLRYFSELDYYEISKKMNLNIKSVYKLIYKGLDSLREIYQVNAILIILYFFMDN